MNKSYRLPTVQYGTLTEAEVLVSLLQFSPEFLTSRASVQIYC